ncbi:hypothetical protein GCM10011588_19660 [Nocardia jinanensis]|uniref:Uncharacterized protein n=1 Tax=Nocardia jinanensis TaxID=382504 RepID=A0A917RGB6_9NOCA|nr:hypothetical protein GCM10011588_19660 [Nocardia jinanensis]
MDTVRERIDIEFAGIGTPRVQRAMERRHRDIERQAGPEVGGKGGTEIELS